MSQLVAIITNFLSSISTIALPLLALDIIVSGIALIIPSQKQNEKPSKLTLANVICKSGSHFRFFYF